MTRFLPPIVACLVSMPSFAALNDPIVFVSRQIPDDGSDFLDLSDADKAMPGVGGRERFRVASPGKLLVREPNGSIRTLVDGANPTAASLRLIDVSAPDVSYDGARIAFAGLPQAPAGQTYDRGSHAEPGQWRIFTINADGSGLKQITHDDPRLDSINMGAFLRGGETHRYDDTDPAWLPDGRIVFSSTRWLTVAQYGHARGTNLHVVNADGSGEHRITSERNGADRPIVDPVTGKIVFARWWLNGRFPSDRTDTIRLADRGGFASYELKDGLTINGAHASGGQGSIMSNEWIAASVNPDGTDLALWTGTIRIPWYDNHYYGGAFTSDGVLYGNFFPDFPLTESGGFGGIRRYFRGGKGSEPVWGLTAKTDDLIRKEPPQSLTIIHSATGYAADPLPLPDGTLLFAWARDPATGKEDIGQDYGLFPLNPSNPQTPVPIHDNRGTTELRPKLLRARPLAPIIRDRVSQAPMPTPVGSDSEINRDGTFAFEALNVYANGPVDAPMVNAPPVGSATKIRFFADYQRAPLNADITLNYPVLLGEMPVSAAGAARHPSLPANVSLFEDLRGAAGRLPLTAHDLNSTGGAFVTGLNFGRPGEAVRCVGCHAGHTQIPVPATAEEAQWTNLAPGALVSASSTAVYGAARLVNRYARLEESFEHWRSRDGVNPAGQWAMLKFPVPVKVRTVRLYGPNSDVRVQGVTVALFQDEAGTVPVGSRDAGPVAQTGTDVAFADVSARAVRVEFKSVSGANASLAEIEVVASGGADSSPPPPPGPDRTPPSAPTNLTARLTQGKPQLSWGVSNDGPGVAVAGYAVMRDGGKVADVQSPGFTDSSAAAGRAYRYSVVARDSAGNLSTPSNAITVNMPPTVPGNVAGTLNAQKKPTVSWSASVSAVGISRYAIYREGVSWATSRSLTITDSSAAAGRRYRYEVEAVDTAGRRSGRSAAVTVSVP